MLEFGFVSRDQICELGTNGHNNYERLYAQIIGGLEPGHRLILVTPYDGRPNANGSVVTKTAEYIRSLDGIYPFITIADWAAIIGEQPGLLAGDRVHLGGQEAMSLYTDCVAEALAEASTGSVK